MPTYPVLAEYGGIVLANRYGRLLPNASHDLKRLQLGKAQH